MSNLHLTISAPIATERLLLRPFALDDLDDLCAIQSLPEVARYLYWEPRNRTETEASLERKVAQTSIAGEGDAIALAVTLPGAAGTTTGVIGDVSFWWHSLEHQQIEVGYVFNPAFGGRGFATEAVRAAIDLAFRELRPHRIFGCTDARNTASANLMRRLGMRQEAHFIGNEWFKGEWGDEFVFAVLEAEWHDARRVAESRATLQP